MKNPFVGPHLVFLVLAVILFPLGQVGLGAVAFLLWIAILALTTMRNTAARVAEDPREEMDAESRSLFAPVRRLTNEIEEIVERGKESAIMRVVGSDAISESRAIHDQVAKALAVRDDLKRSLRERNSSRAEAESLKAKAEAETDPTVKTTLLGAYEARLLELSHYSQVEETIANIDSSTRQAEAALSEMKARLSTKLSGEKAASATEDTDLRETIGRLKALSISYDEAEEMLRN